jgi:hypothetical protein
MEEFLGGTQETAMYRWRIDQTERAGFDHLHAVALAMADDRQAWRKAIDLVKHGCDHATAVRIAL